MYAIYTQIYGTGSPYSSRLFVRVNDVVSWMQYSRLQLNLNKMEFMRCTYWSMPKQSASHCSDDRPNFHGLSSWCRLTCVKLSRALLRALQQLRIVRQPVPASFFRSFVTTYWTVLLACYSALRHVWFATSNRFWTQHLSTVPAPTE